MSASWIIVVGYPRNPLHGRYIEGPRTPQEVKSEGYRFTTDRAKAWPFPNERQAMAKLRIVARHMSWGEGELVIWPKEESAT